MKPLNSCVISGGGHDDTSEKRSYLYLLEKKDIVRMESQRKKNELSEKNQTYQYSWLLTEKGNTLIAADDVLRTLWERGDLRAFYEEITKRELNRIYFASMRIFLVFASAVLRLTKL